MRTIKIAKHWRVACSLSALVFLSVSVSAVGAFSVKPSAVLAQSDTYVADTSSQVPVSSLVSGARYLFSQFSAKTQKIEILDGSTTSSKQIPFCSPDYSSLANLQSDASSQAFRFVTLESATGQSGSWYIRRNSDNSYFSSNGSSDLVFSTSNVYSSTNRTYFVPSAGSASNTIRFSVYNDTGLFLGTKVEGAYFDTWHDGTSIATKDFILYRVYNQDEEAANYATSFVSTIGSVCLAGGNTPIASLHSAWSTMESAWGNLSLSAQSVIKSAAASSDSAAEKTAQCKAKYLYIQNKYSSDSSITDFMGLGTGSAASFAYADQKANDWDRGIAASSLLLCVSFWALSALRRRKQKGSR